MNISLADRYYKVIYNNGQYNTKVRRRLFKSSDREHFEYRIGVHNPTKKTIHSVAVHIQINQEKIYKKGIHYETGENICDINPNAIEIFTIKSVDKESKVNNLTVEIRVTGSDIPATITEIVL
jgi:hypothetical protein